MKTNNFIKLLILVQVMTVNVAQAQKPTVGIKNFRQYLASLEVATGVKASKVSSIVSFYTQNVTRLPKNGVVTELNGPTLMTYTALAGLFCQEHAQMMLASGKSPIQLDEKLPGGHVTDVDQQKKISMINGYAQLFLDRNATPLEIQNLLNLSQSLQSSSNMKMAISFCTAFGASLEFIAE